MAFLALHSEYVRQLAREAHADFGDAGAAAGRVNGGFPGAVTAQPQVDSDIDVLYLQVKRTAGPAAGRRAQERDVSHQ